MTMLNLYVRGHSWGIVFCNIFGDYFMTEKLYDLNSYLKEFDATVISCNSCPEGLYEVILDKTAFFPEEGGQTSDIGKIGFYNVLDVQLKEGRIIHYMKEPQPIGCKVHCEIDWNHRFSNMQMHSGEHIFSGIINKEYGFNNVGFHLSDNSATCDYDGKLTEDDIRRVELLTNRVIWENHSVRTYFPDKSELVSLNYRSKSGIEGDVRIVEISDVDVCACCAPHVANTSEIGIFKVVSFEAYKGGIRVNFLCGLRAFEDYRRLTDMEVGLSRRLNIKRSEISDTVDKMQSSIIELQYSNVALRRIQVGSICESVDKGVVFLQERDADLLRFSIGELKSRFYGLCISFAGSDESGYRFLAEFDGEDLTPFFEKLKASFEVRGGGRNGSIQGSINGKKHQILAFIEENCSEIFEN